jgi:hypothetical protein
MAKKQCKGCGAFVGVRTLVCACGASFSSKVAVKVAVKASVEPMVKNAEKNVSQSISTVKNVLQKISTQEEQVPTRKIYSSNKRRTLTPSGDCPIKPKGYKKNWEDGPASNEVIQNWAVDVYNSHDGIYTVDAVIYWARFYWDINGSEYNRVREVIWQTLSPNTPPELQFS